MRNRELIDQVGNREVLSLLGYPIRVRTILSTTSQFVVDNLAWRRYKLEVEALEIEDYGVLNLLVVIG